MYCDNCGAENRDGANFCHSCGQSFSHIAAKKVATPHSSDPPVSSSSVDKECASLEHLNGILNGRYELKEMLGRGGIGVIYRARDRQLGMDVAIKFLRDSLANNFTAVESLKHEARAAMRLAHPNIVRLFNFEDTADVKYVLMEYIKGESLASIASRKPGRCFTEGEVISYASEVCEALKYAHAQNVIHRDVKPSNIIVTDDGRTKIADFGVASVAETFTERIEGDVSGTPSYMSPEQIQGQPLDGRSDIYSLGVTMYEMLAGKPPTRPKDVSNKLIPVMPDPISGVSDWMNNIVLKCLRRDPDARWRDADELKNVLTGKKEVAMGVKTKHRPWWLMSEEERKASSPKASTPVPLASRVPDPPQVQHYRHTEVHKTALPSQGCKIIDRVDKLDKYADLYSHSPEHERARMTLGSLAGVVGGLLILLISRLASRSPSDMLMIQLSWVIYGGFIGGAAGLAHKKIEKGLLSVTFGMIGGLAAGALLNSFPEAAAVAGSTTFYYRIFSGAAIGAFLGMADGIYERSIRYLIRCFLWGGLGGTVGGAVFSIARYVFSAFWSPFLNWVILGAALGFFVNMGVAFVERPWRKA